MNKMSRKKNDRREEKSPYDQHILDLARVTRVTEGGKHLSFRAVVILGDRAGRVGLGVAKGKDVQLAVEKSVRQAKKHLMTVPMVNETIPHPVVLKSGAAIVMIKPAPRGSGIIAGGAMRAVFELAGIPNVSAKILCKTKNKLAIARATLEALGHFKARTDAMKKATVAPVAAVPAATVVAEAAPAEKPAAKVKAPAAKKTKEKKAEEQAAA